jgi:hypothetical protein
MIYCPVVHRYRRHSLPDNENAARLDPHAAYGRRFMPLWVSVPLISFLLLSFGLAIGFVAYLVSKAKPDRGVFDACETESSTDMAAAQVSLALV